MSTTPKQLASWDASRQEAWRAKNPQGLLVFHFVLDASPSMYVHREALMKAYNMYLGWLQRTAPAMSLGEVYLFDLGLEQVSPLQGLRQLKPLTSASYRPDETSGTALYQATGRVCSQDHGPGQHVFILFTDGEDSGLEASWTAGTCKTLLETLQEQDNWLCVFLGAFPQALDVARAMGFLAGNSLTFSSDQIPQAFQTLKQATQRYLGSPIRERKLLAAAGIFEEEK